MVIFHSYVSLPEGIIEVPKPCFLWLVPHEHQDWRLNGGSKFLKGVRPGEALEMLWRVPRHCHFEQSLCVVENDDH
jgi:hypothetical protein